MFNLIYVMLISMFLMMIHPISLIMIIMSISILSSFMLIYMSMNFWSVIIIVLAFVSGLMILFLYTSSLTPNFKMLSKNYYMMIFPSFIISILLNFSHKNLYINTNFNSINMIYINNWINIFFCLFIIIVMLNFIMKMIYKPYSPLKSIYEKKY